MLVRNFYGVANMLGIYLPVSLFTLAPTTLIWVFWLKKDRMLNDLFANGFSSHWRQWLKLYLIISAPFWLLTFFLWNPPIYGIVMSSIVAFNLLDQVTYYHVTLTFWLIFTINWYGYFLSSTTHLSVEPH